MYEPRQDIFISHASADKQEYIYPLTQALSIRDVTFWLDDVEIHWGDTLAGMINAGLRTSQFAVLCLSANFIRRPWPEAEMSAALAMQNTAGSKTVLPLILNSKDDVLRQYPLIAGLAYREFSDGPDRLAGEISLLVGSKEKKANEITVTVESAHTGKLCHLRTPKRASVRWLATKAQSGLELKDTFRVAEFVEFHIRWVLVDVKAENEWLQMPREMQRKIHAIVASTDAEFKVGNGRTRLEELDVADGTIFHLYVIEDEDYDLEELVYAAT